MSNGIKCWNTYIRTIKKNMRSKPSATFQPYHLLGWNNSCVVIWERPRMTTCSSYRDVEGEDFLWGRLALARISGSRSHGSVSKGSQSLRGCHPSAGARAHNSIQPYISCTLCFLAIFIFRKIEERELYIKSSQGPTSFISHMEESSWAK